MHTFKFLLKLCLTSEHQGLANLQQNFKNSHLRTFKKVQEKKENLPDFQLFKRFFKFNYYQAVITQLCLLIFPRAPYNNWTILSKIYCTFYTYSIAHKEKKANEGKRRQPLEEMELKLNLYYLFQREMMGINFHVHQLNSAGHTNFCSNVCKIWYLL